MRMMLTAHIDTEAGNKAFLSGELGALIGATMERMKPEAAYFTTNEGVRTAYFFFDMKDSSEMPVLGEELFTKLKAKLTLTPVMNGDDLKTGLGKLAK